jgi:hypothetical protein
MSPILLYLIIGFTVFVAVMMGRSLDQRQSNEHQTWKTGVVGWKTIQQSIILGLIGGPLVWLLKGRAEELWFCVICMMAAPLIVDVLRPQVTLHTNMPEPVRAELVTKINKLNLAGVIVGVILLGSMIAFSAGAFTLPTPSQSCKTCKE